MTAVPVKCSFCDREKAEVIGSAWSEAKICDVCVVEHVAVLVRRLAQSRAREDHLRPASMILDRDAKAPFKRVRELESVLGAIETRCEDEDSDLARIVGNLAAEARRPSKDP